MDRRRKASIRGGHVLAVAACTILAGAALPALAATNTGVSVKPSSGSTGTNFTISFVTPAAAPKGAYKVHGKVAGTPVSGCQPTFDFANPKRVTANSHVKFAFRATSAQNLCTGRWTVTVKRGGRAIGPSGHFNLS